MLTIENLKAFSEILDITRIELNELIKIRSEEKLFDNSDDYHNALYTCKYYPQDFFRLRLFDVSICLRFNNRMHKFYIKIDYVKEIPDIKYFEKFFNEYKVKTQWNESNIYIDNNYKFEEVVKIFYEYCIEFLKYKISDDKLFYI